MTFKKKYNVIKSKQQSFQHLSANYDNLVRYNDVRDIFLSRKETFPMKANLDMGNNKIYDVKNDTRDDGVVNKGCIDKVKNDHQTLVN